MKLFLKISFPCWLVVTLLFFTSLCTVPICSEASGQIQEGYSIQVAFPQLTFTNPVGIYSLPDSSDRFFIVEQPGTIRVFQNTNSSSSAVFLDIRGNVLFGGEQGLLGLAFHPRYAQNGFFYVDYVAANPTRTVIARYSVMQSNPMQADASSEFILLEILQPFDNHKGGQIAFGPDGYLYIGVGDGGSYGDPFGNGQNCSTLLGKVLRVDVDGASSGRAFGVPADNPFVGVEGFREEIYAYGFRNPWRFSFDNAGRLWVGDVGQDRREEIDIVENGKNYGWNIMEGSLLYAGGNTSGLELPVYEYDRSSGIAVVGGYTYSGSALPALFGAYIYGDYGTGNIWALHLSSTATVNELLLNSNLVISSFGLDQAGEIYVCAFDGRIYRLTPTVIPEFPLWIFGAAILAFVLIVTVVFRCRSRFFPSLGKHSP